MNTTTTTAAQLVLPYSEPLPAHVLVELASRVRSGWQADAACAGADPALFDDPDEHPDDAAAQQRAGVARSICHDCPVRRSCLYTALLEDEHGIWGGHTNTDREEIRSHLTNPIRRAAILVRRVNDRTQEAAA